MRVFGIDPGSERTGYGCVETDGRRHQLVACGAISAAAGDSFPDRLARIHRELTALLASCQPQCVAVESIFHAVNVRSALKLGHARGVAVLAAVEAGCTVVEYTPAEIKRAVVGYGRAEKPQVQQMIKLLLGLDTVPSPHDAADALAVAICHIHATPVPGFGPRDSIARVPDPGFRVPKTAKSWRQYRPPGQRMIAFLRGRLLDKQPNRVIVDVQGVGYELHVPLSTYYEMGDEGSEIGVHVHTHVREDALQLFGFLTTLEQQVFERLIGISGIGPKLAIAVLSGIETRELVLAVQRADVARLTSIPGIGKKTAERIVLELKDRLAKMVVPAGTAPAAASSADRLRDDLLSALQNLGYHRPLAEKAVDKSLAAADALEFEPALKGALRELMR